MSFIVIIPVRLFSVRFPRKALANIQGQPMIVHVVRKALMSKAKKVIIATDHIDIVQTIKKEKLNADIFLSRVNHQSGTERLLEVINKYKFANDQIIVNLQGDEPLISPDMINCVADDLSFFNNVNMSTLASRIMFINEKYDKNVVKVVVDINGYALYFSRSMIPWCKKDFLPNCHCSVNNILLKHIGIYSYRVDFIRRYVDWGFSPLEKLESLEQLRVLWHGEKIHVSIINDDIYYINVDTLEELNQVNLFLEQ